MYTPPHLLIAPQDKLSLFRKHIPKQKEIDALLKDLRKRVLHNLMVNLDTKDLIEHYSKSLRYRDIYNYIADGRLPGIVEHAKENCWQSCQLCNCKRPIVQNSPTQRKQKMGSLFIISNTREIRIEHLKHVPQQSISYASRPVQNISDNEKAILFPKHASQNTKIYRSMHSLSKNKSKEY